MFTLTPASDFRINEKDLLRAGSLGAVDLLPCPFCGSAPLSVAYIGQNPQNVVATVFCSNTKCYVKMVECRKLAEENQAREEVEARWNRRA